MPCLTIDPISDRVQSAQYMAQARTQMPGGVSSPIRSFRTLGCTPLVIDRGEGDSMIDIDGNTYIDFCGSWGALILGHAHPGVVAAAQAQIAKGSSFGLCSPLEGDLAEKIIKATGVDRVRFVSTGTEATMTALRIARAYSKRNKIVKFSGHYHGHVDALLIQSGSGCLDLNPTASSEGIPLAVIQHTLSISFNDLDAVFLICQDPDIAAIIVEPVPANMGVVPPLGHFLEYLRQETARHGIVLIFDEVITGFRLGLGGAASYFGIEPDLRTYGKVIGGGFPVAAVAGKKGYMELLAPLGGVYQAGTLSGNPVAMAAGLATLSHIENSGFYEELEIKTRYLTDPISQWIQKYDAPAVLHRVGSMFTLFVGTRSVFDLHGVQSCSAVDYRDLALFLLSQGVYISPLQCEANFISEAHSIDHIDYTRELILHWLQRTYA